MGLIAVNSYPTDDEEPEELATPVKAENKVSDKARFNKRIKVESVDDADDTTDDGKVDGVGRGLVPDGKKGFENRHSAADGNVLHYEV